ncbi:hypothetical protein DFH09DRAFT_1330468 [Mycena vulgaris]|nr:hypothetical protein DFH09DRAFT_1330468 [Mycena vulgaris]
MSDSEPGDSSSISSDVSSAAESSESGPDWSDLLGSDWREPSSGSSSASSTGSSSDASDDDMPELHPAGYPDSDDEDDVSSDSETTSGSDSGDDADDEDGVELEGMGLDEHVVEVLFWIAKSPEGAQAVVDASVLDSVKHISYSPSRHVRRETLTAVLGATPRVDLVWLLREHSFSWLHDDAVSALAQISEHPEGVATIAATGILRR